MRIPRGERPAPSARPVRLRFVLKEHEYLNAVRCAGQAPERKAMRWKQLKPRVANQPDREIGLHLSDWIPST